MILSRSNSNIILTRKDLLDLSKTKRIDEINAFDFKISSMTRQDYLKKAFVAFIDDDGKHLILKDRDFDEF